MEDKELFSRVLRFVKGKSYGILRADGTPFIEHLMKIAELIEGGGYVILFCDYRMDPACRGSVASGELRMGET